MIIVTTFLNHHSLKIQWMSSRLQLTMNLKYRSKIYIHYIDDLIVPITSIINLPMSDGVVPHDFKPALVYPLIKKKTRAGMTLRSIVQYQTWHLCQNTGYDCSQTTKCTRRRTNCYRTMYNLLINVFIVLKQRF